MKGIIHQPEPDERSWLTKITENIIGGRGEIEGFIRSEIDKNFRPEHEEEFTTSTNAEERES